MDKNITTQPILSNTLWRWTILLLIFFLIFCFYTNKVDDLDLWWHLKTGQYTLENKSLPKIDPFAFSTSIAKQIREDEQLLLSLDDDLGKMPLNKEALRQSWLSQIIFYLCYLFFGFKGLGILKAILWILIFYFLYLTMARKKSNIWITYIMIIWAAYLGQYFTYTRPQIFSFLFTSVLIFLLIFFNSEKYAKYFIPLVMLLWANLHGGYILGWILLMIFAIAESLKFLLSRYIFGQ